jgi:hypothetical protein
MPKEVINDLNEQFSSQSEAASAYNCRPSGISQACQKTRFGVYQRCAGRQWALCEDIGEYFQWPVAPASKKVVVCSDGGRFNSIAEAALAFNVRASNLYAVIAATAHGHYATCVGFQFADAKTADKPDFAWPKKRCQIVASDGRTFLSRSEAARAFHVRPAHIERLLNHTLAGHIALIDRVQLAWTKDFEQPDFKWPEGDEDVHDAIDRKTIVNELGERFESTGAAAKAYQVLTSRITEACHATEFGAYMSVGGHQWSRGYLVTENFQWPVKKCKPKAVVRSDGHRFDAVREAARVCGLRPAMLRAALDATETGYYREHGGFQFAYADTADKPEFVWPTKKQRGKQGQEVVTSDGRTFPSLTNAARELQISYNKLTRLINKTRAGRVAKVGDIQLTTKDDFERPDFQWPR